VELIKMLLADKWRDYELIDAGEGEKLERWGDIILRRPDPQVIWSCDKRTSIWNECHAHFIRDSKSGVWKFKKEIPAKWEIEYNKLKFYIEPTSFKHTGLFPEQSVNWDWIIEKIKSFNKPVKVLNLFAYTGGATIACLYANAHVCHVDASKTMVQRAKENTSLSNFMNRSVRFITDDVIKFVTREIRRGNRYDAIIMDPPSYGRGPSGEMWKMEDDLYKLIEKCILIMSNTPLFFLINSYTTGFSPIIIENILKLTLQKKYGGHFESFELGLPIRTNNLILPCGSTARWEA
jgi:23S rRNA (cytosine1962-C5)-methyltransferase